MRYRLVILLIISILTELPSVAGTPGVKVKRAEKGIIVIGDGADTRAVEPFNGKEENGIAYANAISRYGAALKGKGVNVYSMVIPTAVAYYCPDTARNWTKDERAAIDVIKKALSADVKAVDVYDALYAHRDEPIYLRTDHHWAPLAAYYAANEFAKAANAPFRGLECYDTVMVRDFVGTMYKFSKDASVKNAPEDFVYHVPRDISYTATYIKYSLGKNRQVTGESKPEAGDFFLRYDDGNSAAYCTFMGGDTRTVTVRTAADNGRRLAIVKDSYGNALPGYLFSSFEEIHVLDFRYYSKGIVKYVTDNKITDLLFANNLGHAYSPVTAQTINRLLGTNETK